jgi:hypothetical protein
MRKRIIRPEEVTPQPSGQDVASLATVLVTSESEDHPLEYAFDGRGGAGGSYWMAGEPGEQTVILEFDEPQTVRGLTLEIEETEISRTQEIVVSVSGDGGATYREVLRQEYTFSPRSTTFEREEWQLTANRVSHLRLRITPDKGGIPCPAKLTSLVLH